MHFPTILTALLFTTATLATPYTWAEPQPRFPSNSSRHGNRKANHTHKHEKTPTFKQPCICQQPVVPVNLLSENEKCLLKYSTQMGCYLSSKGGCPSPAPACGKGRLRGSPKM